MTVVNVLEIAVGTIFGHIVYYFLKGFVTGFKQTVAKPSEKLQYTFNCTVPQCFFEGSSSHLEVIHELARVHTEEHKRMEQMN